MNDRINELFDTALDAVIPNTWTNLNMDQLNDIKNKFAELIVKECAEVCGQQQYYDADDEHKRGVNGGSITCMNAIKRHFGVE